MFMLFLVNFYNEVDLVEFDKQIKCYVNILEEQDIEYVVEFKFDGGSIVVVYEND